MANPEDKELQAMQVVVSALTPLDSEARGRVLDYVFKRLGFKALAPSSLSAPAAPLTRGATEASGPGAPGVQPDIRTLKTQKSPHSAVEMAAMVAYYLAEIAPSNERKDTIGTSEMQKYFKQANYPLPKFPVVTLAHAASAGYLDQVSRGQYRLNPVGYNLVVHSLPSQPAEGGPRRVHKTGSKRSRHRAKK